MNLDEEAILPSTSLAVAAGAITFWFWSYTDRGHVDAVATLLTVLAVAFAARRMQDYLRVLRDRARHERRIGRR